jgi:hypothetical protein
MGWVGGWVEPRVKWGWGGGVGGMKDRGGRMQRRRGFVGGIKDDEGWVHIIEL